MKKIAAIGLFIIGGILIAEKIIGKIILYLFTRSVSGGNESWGIIGGADGPTAIVLTTVGGYSWITFVVGIILVIVGIIIIKKK